MDIRYTVLYSNRKTLALSVERDKSIIVHSPKNATDKDIVDFIERKRYWLHSKLKHPQKYTQSSKIQFISGAAIPYLGKNYKLKLINNSQDKIIFNNVFKISRKNKNKANDMFKEWYSQRALSKIAPKAEHYAKNIGVNYNSIKISELKYRWGSCTPRKNLKFNWRIIKGPISVVEYIIVHELTHLREENHTKEFWKIVKSQLPKYKQSKEWLKVNGHLLERDF